MLIHVYPANNLTTRYKVEQINLKIAIPATKTFISLESRARTEHNHHVDPRPRITLPLKGRRSIASGQYGTGKRRVG